MRVRIKTIVDGYLPFHPRRLNLNRGHVHPEGRFPRQSWMGTSHGRHGRIRTTIRIRAGRPPGSGRSAGMRGRLCLRSGKGRVRVRR